LERLENRIRAHMEEPLSFVIVAVSANGQTGTGSPQVPEDSHCRRPAPRRNLALLQEAADGFGTASGRSTPITDYCAGQGRRTNENTLAVAYREKTLAMARALSEAIFRQ
jgi:hypothetical protein